MNRIATWISILSLALALALATACGGGSSDNNTTADGNVGGDATDTAGTPDTNTPKDTGTEDTTKPDSVVEKDTNPVPDTTVSADTNIKPPNLAACKTANDGKFNVNSSKVSLLRLGENTGTDNNEPLTSPFSGEKYYDAIAELLFGGAVGLLNPMIDSAMMGINPTDQSAIAPITLLMELQATDLNVGSKFKLRFFNGYTKTAGCKHLDPELGENAPDPTLQPSSDGEICDAAVNYLSFQDDGGQCVSQVVLNAEVKEGKDGSKTKYVFASADKLSLSLPISDASITLELNNVRIEAPVKSGHNGTTKGAWLGEWKQTDSTIGVISGIICRDKIKQLLTDFGSSLGGTVGTLINQILPEIDCLSGLEALDGNAVDPCGAPVVCSTDSANPSRTNGVHVYLVFRGVPTNITKVCSSAEFEGGTCF